MLDLGSLRNTHALDRAITEGVDMTLEGNPDYVWRVRVPSQYNRAYAIAAAGAAKFRIDDAGETSIAAGIEAMHAQRRAFFDHCIVSVNGEPVPPAVYDEFPNVVQELYSKALVIAEELSRKVEDAVGKSLPS